jgi:hypothetical protein
MDFQVPLNFWFNEDARLSVPIVSFKKLYITMLEGCTISEASKSIKEHIFYCTLDTDAKAVGICSTDGNVFIASENPENPEDVRLFYAKLSENKTIYFG